MANTALLPAALAQQLPSLPATPWEAARAAAVAVLVPAAAWLLLVLLRCLACALSPSHEVGGGGMHAHVWTSDG